MLTIEKLQRPGLAPVTLSLGPGEAVAVMGPSGAGKTLLLRAIADLDPNDGAVALDGNTRDSMTAPRWRRLVGYLPAESGWWADRVGAPFATPAEAVPLVEALGLSAEALDWPVARLSTGERQRLALARLLANAPKVLLLDEPTSGLDEAATERAETLLKQRLAQGCALLFATHSHDQARRLARRCLRVEHGQVREAAL
ncbi:MAG: ATP-binding cassette domain-containing protein [Candidatus Eiseniibacteriota bacterium]